MAERTIFITIRIYFSWVSFPWSVFQSLTKITELLTFLKCSPVHLTSPLPAWYKSLKSKPQSRSLPFLFEAGLWNSILHGISISQNSLHKWKMICYPSCLSWVRSNCWNQPECVWCGWSGAHQESLHEKQNKTKKRLNVSLGGFQFYQNVNMALVGNFIFQYIYFQLLCSMAFSRLCTQR